MTTRLEPRAAGALYAPPATTRRRVDAVDVVRGFAMVLMALDHVRDYVSRDRFQPEDLSRATAALFATRWVTHFCAPTFFLLAGVGIGLALQRGRDVAAMRRFLVTRGLWLVALDLTASAIGWQLGFRLLPAFALVLWALGWSMVVLAAMIGFSRSSLLMIALVTIAAHNLFDGVPPQAFGALAPLWHLLHVPGFAVPGVLFVGYPLIPWFAVMTLGVALAEVWEWEPARRRALLVRAGVAAIAAFVVLRALNGYGDPAPWTPQRTPALTVASFLNVRKYPPSLDFVLMTIGSALLALAIAERARGAVSRFLAVYGGVPLFYYLGHIYVAHLVAIALVWIQTGTPQRLPVVSDPAAIPAGYGVELAGVYASWALVVLLMYAPCRWFGELKARRSEWWLRYL